MAKNKSAGKSNSDSEIGIFHALGIGGLKKIAGLFRNSFIVRFLSGYDQAESCAENSLTVQSARSVRNYIRKKTTRKPSRELINDQINQQEVGVFVPSTLHRSMKNRIGSAMESSVVLQKSRRLLQNALNVSMMSYGVFFFSFGLFTTVMQALLYFLLRTSNESALDLFVGLALVLLSLPIMFKGYEPVLDSLKDSVAGDFLLRILRTSSSPDPNDKVFKPTFLFFIAGMTGGLLTYFAPPLVVLVMMIIVITALCVLYVPEIGVCLILLLLPFISEFENPSLVCAAIILYTGLCLLLKVIVGKRSVSFGLLDGVALFFAVYVLSTGINCQDASVQSALLYAAMISGYFVVTNLLRSPAWIRRSVAFLSISSFAVAITGIVAKVFNLGVEIALLKTPLVAICYLLTVIPIVLAGRIQADKAIVRLGYLVILIADVACLILQGSALGMIALVVELLFFFIFYTRKVWIALFLFLLSLPFVSYWMWPSASAVIEMIRSFGNRELWNAMWCIYREAPISGIGMSDGILSDLIWQTTSADLAYSSTWLRLLVQVGLPGLLIFSLFILLWYMAGFTLIKKHGTKLWASCYHLAISASLTGLLLVGNFSYLWSDNRLLLLFWMCAGLARALQRMAKRNENTTEEPPSRPRSDGVYCVDCDFTFLPEELEEQDY